MTCIDHDRHVDGCSGCWTTRDIEENPELYKALAGS